MHLIFCTKASKSTRPSPSNRTWASSCAMVPTSTIGLAICATVCALAISFWVLTRPIQPSAFFMTVYTKPHDGLRNPQNIVVRTLEDLCGESETIYVLQLGRTSGTDTDGHADIHTHSQEHAPPQRKSGQRNYVGNSSCHLPEGMIPWHTITERVGVEAQEVVLELSLTPNGEYSNEPT